MKITETKYEGLMKIVVRIADVVALAKRFEESPALAMREVVAHMRDGVRDALKHVMKAELEVFLGRGEEAGNKRNGFVFPCSASRAFLPRTAGGVPPSSRCARPRPPRPAPRSRGQRLRV